MIESGANYAILAYAVSLLLLGGYAVVLGRAYWSARRHERRTSDHA